ncbi:MAG: hypothetical protein E7425_08825 [Ruminococcaceae bacterium]|nr:hypothetical protein [Oscillospiraceae bacterium]
MTALPGGEIGGINMKKKLGGILLSLALLLSLAPTLGGNAGAVPGNAAESSAVRNGDTVWFGKKNDRPIAWRVLSAADDHTLPVSGIGSVLLISKYVLGTTRFSVNNVWADSGEYGGAKYWCEKFYDNWPDGPEKDAITATFVTEAEDYRYTSKEFSNERGGTHGGNVYGPASLSAEHFFFLSAEEADTYFSGDDDRKTYALTKSGDVESSASWWWLRSPYIAFNDYAAGSVDNDGWVSDYVTRLENGARPAFNFDLNSDFSGFVLFASAVAGGKSLSNTGAIQVLPSNRTREWKLTLWDRDRADLTVTQTAVTAEIGGTVSLAYNNAQTGENEYVSALLCDEAGAMIGYGSMKAESANGTAVFTLPNSLLPGRYALKVFSEQRNGDRESDYACGPVSVALTLIGKATVPARITEGTALTKFVGDRDFTLHATAAGASDGAWTWSSSDTSVATVTNAGTVHILKAGKAAITARYEDETRVATTSLALTVLGTMQKPAAFVSGSTLKWRAKLPDTGKSVTVIAAWYDASGRMLGMESETITAAGAASGDLTVGADAAQYKLMFVDAATCAPLCPAWDSKEAT